ncbi:type III-B CRISPR module RAMP protein Cmr4 [Kingella negevensis]|uniref:type III-B CRISPR module RAMP protein Cmr4 n=1 Tax=Kingella negevensis TaxID=1522312 RepID=UPI00254CDA2C|nr:type III-B CRISPR module RAMP protein Cmr4 [Kingella negevensis]MDK4681149.1 type III-B CRISPR module RAMP protein Cmr4 [Kingella negevensis]MDK4683352.1 type III-B CRISPR module RAMP protein Cmr4 [Kingella negevensis]MDK4691518.1 type III-B CRISPR module RAMP protein Cmr4 [Kingella negevensis]MDK4693331.1 type III-B CRISPR module RAMP protein Cmr4 [Kingella negevensis]MDK4699631.1 type III-B CRISPR module RAMP protein Cmr4 [Kingella negevensis]
MLARWAYATCPFILQRYQRDTRDTQIERDIPKVDETAKVVSGSALLISGNKIALEDLDMDAETDELIDLWSSEIAKAVYPNDTDWQTELQKRFVVLPDNVFSFLADTATEIRMRIKIDRDTRIVKNGALWSEENLPCETVLWGVFGVETERTKNKEKKSADELSVLIPAGELKIQIGGKHTVGRGLCRLLIGENKEA